jgi:hypothetical protein
VHSVCPHTSWTRLPPCSTYLLSSHPTPDALRPTPYTTPLDPSSPHLTPSLAHPLSSSVERFPHLFSTNRMKPCSTLTMWVLKHQRVLSFPSCAILSVVWYPVLCVLSVPAFAVLSLFCYPFIQTKVFDAECRECSALQIWRFCQSQHPHKSVNLRNEIHVLCTSIFDFRLELTDTKTST